MKVLLKFILLVICLMITFILISTVLYSHTVKETGSNIQLQDFVYLLISCLWIALTVFYVAKQSHATPQFTSVALSFSLFFIYAFMTQIEIILFGNEYAAMDIIDVVIILTGNAVPVIVAVILGNKFFGTEYMLSRYAREPKKLTIAEIIIKLLLTALLYVIIYLVFAYFIYWRFGAPYIFYDGDKHATGFILQIIKTWKNMPEVYLIEFVRGLLYGIFLLPIIHIFRKRSLDMLISLVLILEMPVIYLIVPDFLFTDTVREGRLLQQASTMFILAFIIWVIFSKIRTLREE